MDDASRVGIVDTKHQARLDNRRSRGLSSGPGLSLRGVEYQGQPRYPLWDDGSCRLITATPLSDCGRLGSAAPRERPWRLSGYTSWLRCGRPSICA